MEGPVVGVDEFGGLKDFVRDSAAPFIATSVVSNEMKVSRGYRPTKVEV